MAGKGSIQPSTKLHIGSKMEIGLIFVVCFIFSGVALGFILEKRSWNKGKCRNCGGSWVKFDVDSQGGRGYKCICGKTIWISYPIDN